MGGSSKPKRRLPVLQPDGDEAARPAAQWIAIGAVGTIITSLPLLGLIYLWAAHRLQAIAPGGGLEGLRNATPGQRVSLGMIVVFGTMVALGLAAGLGAMLVGRYGGDAGKNEGTFAGVAAGVVVSLLSAPSSLQAGQGTEWMIGAVTTTITMGVAARVGAAVGVRLRP